MYKLSRYLVTQDFEDQGRLHHLLFSTRTSDLHVVNHGLWQKMTLGTFDSIEPSVFQKFYDSRIIVDHDEDEMAVIIKENHDHMANDSHFYQVIQPTATCPLGCGYCGQVHSPKSLTDDNQDAIIARMALQLDARPYTSMSIGWFGGEPVAGMKVIDKLSPRIQDLAEERGLKYWAKIVTNGLLLNEDIIHRLAHRYAVRDFEITLDGDQEFHDKRRHLKTGGPTFEKIYHNLLLLAKEDKDKVRISVRCNTDARNKDGIFPLLKRLADDGLSHRLSIYCAQIHSWGNDAHKLAASKEEFAEWEIEWFMNMRELGYPVRSYLPRRSKSLCIAVHPRSELVDPFGNVFGCTEVSIVPTYEVNGENIYKLGHVSDDILPHAHRRKIFSDFYDEESLKKYDCYTCPMLPTCGGGCPKEWQAGNKPCPSTKFNIRERMMLQYLDWRKNHLQDADRVGDSKTASDPLTAQV